MPEPRTYAMEPFFHSDPGMMVAHIPQAVRLGMQVVSIGPSRGTVRVPWNDELVGDPRRGVVFGGVITTLLDQASGIAVQCSLPEFRTIATLDLRVDYLRAAAPGHDLTAMAECYRLTSNVAFVRGSAWDVDPGDPFAHMVATFMIVGPVHPGSWQVQMQKGTQAVHAAAEMEADARPGNADAGRGKP